VGAVSILNLMEAERVVVGSCDLEWMREKAEAVESSVNQLFVPSDIGIGRGSAFPPITSLTQLA